MKRTMKLTFLSIIAIAALSSCNTTIGLGRDMRVLGAEMEKKADEAYNGGGGTTEDFSGGAPNYSGGAPVY
jgi:predicted small secreted protein